MSKIKNKRLALLLSFLACHPGLNALDQKPSVNMADKTLTESEKEKDLQKPIAPKSSWIKKTLKGLAYGVGGYSFIRTADDFYNSHQKSKMLSSLNEYKSLPYNKRLRKFFEITDKLMTEHNKHDNGVWTDYYSLVKNLINNLILFKSDDDVSKDIFASVKSARGVVCGECTHVLQTIAEHLGIKAYRLWMWNTKTNVGHGTLLIANALEGDHSQHWMVIDGRNYLKLKKSFKQELGMVKLSDYLAAKFNNHVIGTYFDKKYIFYRNIASGTLLHSNNQIVAELNQKLLDQLYNGQDLDWTDDSYVKKFNVDFFIEKFTKPKF